jgi:hypothetical protein
MENYCRSCEVANQKIYSDSHYIIAEVVQFGFWPLLNRKEGTFLGVPSWYKRNYQLRQKIGGGARLASPPPYTVVRTVRVI